MRLGYVIFRLYLVWFYIRAMQNILGVEDRPILKVISCL